MNRSEILKRSILTLVAIVLTGSFVAADVPRLIHYQGKLRDAGGSPVSGSVNLSFKLYPHATESGSILFEESHADVPVANGLFNILIGSQTLGGVPDSALDAAEVFLGIAINFGDELAPRPRIGSSPHAIKSTSAEQLVIPDSFTPAATVDGTGNVGIGTSTPAAKLDVDGDGSTVLVPRKTNSGDPTGLDGMIYYNAAEGKFRGHEDGSWADMRDGSGSASDPCNCPQNPWTLVGVLNSTLAGTGESWGSIDISDNTKEYLFGVAAEAEFNVASSPPLFLGRRIAADTAPAFSWVVSARDESGAWRSFLTVSGNRSTLAPGALWNSAGGAEGVVFSHSNGNGHIRVYSNGTAALLDNSAGTDYAAIVFSRVP